MVSNIVPDDPEKELKDVASNFIINHFISSEETLHNMINLVVNRFETEINSYINYYKTVAGHVFKNQIYRHKK